MPSTLATTTPRPHAARWLARSLGISLAVAASGCLSEVRVVDEDGLDTGEDLSGQGMVPAQVSTSTGIAGGDMTPSDGDEAPSEDPGVFLDPMLAPSVPPVVPEITPTCGSERLMVAPRCGNEPEVLITGLSDVYDLSVTDDHIYTATWGGIFRVPRAGGMRETLVDEFTSRVLADAERFFWNASSGEVFVQRETEEASSFLPTHSSVDGIEQDEDALFALTDGYLLRVPKDTGEAQILVDGTDGMTSLHWSGTALDDEHVYFVSYSTQLALERIGKDGTDRELLLADFGGAMDRTWLLVDDAYVYYASINGSLKRVPLDGGEPQQLSYSDEFASDLVMTADDECLYYADGPNIYCLAKDTCTTELVHSADEGSIMALAMHDGDLYFGVTVDGPAAAPQGWVGRLPCGG